MNLSRAGLPSSSLQCVPAHKAKDEHFASVYRSHGSSLHISSATKQLWILYEQSNFSEVKNKTVNTLGLGTENRQ